MHFLFLVPLVCFLLPSLVLADDVAPGQQHSHAHTVGDHAPIGVMGDHMHKAGEFMLSYRYMFMDMDGNRSGSNSLSTDDVLAQFPVSPTDMDMEMHMLGIMFAPNDWFTAVAMLPFVDISMNHVTRTGAEFKTRASGLGDIKLGGLFRLYEEGNHHLHFNGMFSLPSGEIDERDDTPAAANAPLPYPMQLGSGTVDLMPGLTYTGESDRINWGSQILGTIRLGENDNDYTLGDSYEISTWGSYSFEEWVSTSLRIRWMDLQNIDGADPQLNPMMVPTADPNRRAGETLELGLGANFLLTGGAAKGLRLAFEFLIPLYRSLDGPQLETDLTFIGGLQYTF